MKKIILIKGTVITVTLFFLQFSLSGQSAVIMKKYEVDVTGSGKSVVEGNLKLGGTNRRNESIKVNNFYFLVNDKPFIPVTGEFHYSRYPNKYWEESIKKMKAGGINIIATYVFWIIHEEYEGKFDWNGDKDLRKFIELCAQNEIKILVIDKKFALKSWIISIKGEKYVAFSDALLLNNMDSFEFYNSGSSSFDLLIYPMISSKLQLSGGSLTDISGRSSLM